jgi:hypothetical protein
VNFIVHRDVPFPGLLFRFGEVFIKEALHLFTSTELYGTQLIAYSASDRQWAEALWTNLLPLPASVGNRNAQTKTLR